MPLPQRIFCSPRSLRSTRPSARACSTKTPPIVTSPGSPWPTIRSKPKLPSNSPLHIIPIPSASSHPSRVLVSLQVRPAHRQSVIPTGAARLSLPRRSSARRVAQWRDRCTLPFPGHTPNSFTRSLFHFFNSALSRQPICIFPAFGFPRTFNSIMTTAIPITRTTHSRLTEELRETSPFGTNYSDHMFVADWHDGQWHNARIVPFGPMSFSPALTAFHYGQALFEGFKAHHTSDGRVAIFRPMANHARLNRTAERLAMPEIPESIFREGLVELIRTDRDWVPHRDGGSLYIRPVYFGTDDSLMVHAANRYCFVIFTSPGGPYFSQPIRLLAEETYVRAFPGGTGAAK